MVTSRFDKMLRNLTDEYEEEMVVVSLMRYYNLCLNNNDVSILEAIERVLEDYMCTADYNDWLLTRKG
jgi:5-methylcytosine-specific restriction endonuclease McrBC GTP-binding regulatory subunit McrB